MSNMYLIVYNKYIIYYRLVKVTVNLVQLFITRCLKRVILNNCYNIYVIIKAYYEKDTLFLNELIKINVQINIL